MCVSRTQDTRTAPRRPGQTFTKHVERARMANPAGPVRPGSRAGRVTVAPVGYRIHPRPRRYANARFARRCGRRDTLAVQ